MTDETKRALSPAGKAFIKDQEKCRLQTYLDIGGVATKGWGAVGPDIKLGDTPWTQAQADERFETDAQKRVDTVLAAVGDAVTLSDNELSALTSLTYNIGGEGLRSSTLLRKLRAGDRSGAADQFVEWDHAHVNGKAVEVPDLKRRRLAEAHLFLTPDEGTATATPETTGVSTVAAPQPSIHAGVTVGAAVAAAAGGVQQAITYAQPIHDGLMGLGIAPHYAAAVIGATFVSALGYVGIKHWQAKNA